jgi:hypothetical protein
MNQLPHAAVCKPIFCGDVVFGESFDEDGSQRLVLAVVGRGISVREEMSAAGVVHDLTSRCELVFGAFLLFCTIRNSMDSDWDTDHRRWTFETG